ncbi:MAG: response regulator [Chitinivibrionales bacterium]|nr:response regulator [Chitinivibrionales bacterium]
MEKIEDPRDQEPIFGDERPGPAKYRRIVRELVRPKIADPDKSREWRLNAFAVLLTFVTVFLAVPLSLVATAFHRLSFGIIVVAFWFSLAAAMVLVRRGRLVHAVNMLIGPTLVTTLTWANLSGNSDSTYLLTFNMLIIGVFLGSRWSMVWAGIYTTSLLLLAMLNSQFVLFPNFDAYLRQDPQAALDGRFLSSPMALIWVAAFLSILFERYYRDLLKQVSDANEQLEELVRLRTAELEVANHLLEQALREEVRLKSRIAERAEEEKSRLQSELVQAKKLEAIGKLAGGVAHDFNNQLNAILGYAELLKARGRGNEKLTHYSAKIMKIISRSADLTNQLLAFARKGKYNPQPLDIHELIRDVADIMRRTMDKRIVLDLDLVEETMTVMGDAAQLHTALLNLTINARDAMHEGGTLKIATDVVTIDRFFIEMHQRAYDLELGRYAKVLVEDTGHGVAPEVMEHIFEPFYTTKQTGKGTGLGLSAVYGSVRHHGGFVEVDSEPGKGAGFTVYLPLYENDVDSSPAQSRPKPVSRNLRLLVVDDELLVLESTAELLEDWGHTVTPFADPIEAARYYGRESETIDAVIVDMVMPRLSGRDLLGRIRAVNPDARAIIVSGYTLEEQAQASLEDPRIGFVPKPFTIEELQDALGKVIQWQIDSGRH